MFPLLLRALLEDHAAVPIQPPVLKATRGEQARGRIRTIRIPVDYGRDWDVALKAAADAAYVDKRLYKLVDRFPPIRVR